MTSFKICSHASQPHRLLRRLTFVLAALPVLIGVLAGCNAKPATQGNGFPAMQVTTQVTPEVQTPVTSEYLATLKSRASAAINPQVEGWIVKINVRSGEHVQQGQTLVEIDQRMQEASVNNQVAARTAQAAMVANADAQYKRAQELFNSGIISKQDFDTYKTTYDNANAQLKALDAQVNQQQVQLHYYNVAAPTAGIVGDIPVHVGDRVSTNTLLTTVDEPGNLEAYIYVPAEHSQDLRAGEPVDLLDTAGKVIAHSTIFFVSPQIDTATQSVLAKAQISNSQNIFRTDQFENARITWRTEKNLVVPVLSTTRINGQFFVFTVQQGPNGPVARQVQIEVGDIVGNDYVVRSGLKSGDHVVTGGGQFLADGVPVKETVKNSSPSGSNS